MSSEIGPNRTDEQKAAVVERILRGDLTLEQARREQGLSDDELEAWVSVYRRTSRRVAEDELNAALSARGLPTHEAPISEFTGGLESLALAELIQTVHYGRKDAVIRVDHGGQRSHIWCEQGEVVDARTARLAGAGAVYRLLSLRDGRVHAEFALEKRTRTIEASTPALLLEAAKRYDECRQLLERIGDTSVIYVASSTAWAAEAALEPDANWQMMRAFDGSSSIERVLDNSTLPDLETLTCLVQLIERRLLTPKPLPTAPQWLPLGSESVAEAEPSFLPLAASLRARLSLPDVSRRRLWYGASVAGASVVAVAFGIGFWSARLERRASVAARAGDGTQASDDGCPLGMARVQGGALSANAPSDPAGGAPGGHEPMLAPFCLSRLEATVAEFDACVAAKGCQRPGREFDAPQLEGAAPGAAAQAEPVTQQCNFGQPGRERYPINCVNVAQAEQFCAWRGGRLPTRLEWEYAADDANPVGEESHRGTLPLGSSPAGGFRCASDLAPRPVLPQPGAGAEAVPPLLTLPEATDPR